MKDAMQGYDYDLPLLDALADPELSPFRRTLAGAMIGEGLDEAYFATQDMVEVYASLWEDARKGVRHGEGYLAMESLLKDANPVQMRLWHLVRDRAMIDTVCDLAWLRSLLLRRGMAARVLREQGLDVRYVRARDRVEGRTAGDMMDDQSVWIH